MVVGDSFCANAAVTAVTSATVIDALSFSFRFTLDAVVDGTEEFEAEVTIDEVVALVLDLQTSFIIFSSNSAHNGTM